VLAARFTAIKDAIPSVEKFFVIDTGSANAAIEALRAAGWSAAPWDELVQAEPAEPLALQPGGLAAIFYTSGTTGPSKGVAMPHGQMYFFGQEVVSLQRVTAADTYLTTTPLFHGNAQFMASYPALIAGARLVIRSKFSASRWVDHLRENQVTVTNLIGVMMDFVWKAPARPNDADNVLRSVYAAPTASSILHGFMERFGIEAMVDAFGLTETAAPILSPYGEIRPPGAAGLVASDYFEIRLVDPNTDREVPIGQIGELTIRYKQPWTCSLGYYGMPEKTVEAWRNLWFHTGDALKRDEAGWYYFVDRYKDALRRRGENISSYEVEQAILSFPAVIECTVLGVPADQEAGEDEVLAVVVVSEAVSPAELWSWCEGRVPAFAIPRFIRFVDAIPRTPSEKVLKSELRAGGVTADTFDRTLSVSAAS
jgi:crotonobetaine/carnitine-CoA ligase